MESGDGVSPWRRKTRKFLGKMGIVGIRDDGTMEMVVVGGDELEMEDD